MLWFGVQGSGRAQKKASSATETQSHEKNGREFHEAQSRDQNGSHRGDAGREKKCSAGVSPALHFFSRPLRAQRPSLGAHASSVLSVSNSPHAGCVRSPENPEESFAGSQGFSA